VKTSLFVHGSLLFKSRPSASTKVLFWTCCILKSD
jgi:hypothetical protein